MGEAFADMRRQMQAGGAPGGARPDFQAIIRRTLAGVLTAEQMARYDELAIQRAGQRQEVRRGRLWVRTHDGRLQARQVGLGLSDGQYTQIIGGDLEAGAAVVTRVREAG